MTSSRPPLALTPAPVVGDGLPIAMVERETGLGKDTLRVWERRYRFPTPSRDASGDRRYSEAQVQQLKLIRRLLDLGARPSKVVGLGTEALQALLPQLSAPVSRKMSKTRSPAVRNGSQLEELLGLIHQNDPSALRQALMHALLRSGLVAFVHEVVAPLSTAVGDAWAQGRFEVFEEHLFTEVVTGVMRHAIDEVAARPGLAQGPKVLLTTVPQEPHGLGLLMVEALLAFEGCTCVSLGTQTPLRDIVLAAAAHRVDVVALSFTNALKSSVVQASLQELRLQLPASTALWAGGSCKVLHQRPHPGVASVQVLAELTPLVSVWRQSHHAGSAQPRPLAG